MNIAKRIFNSIIKKTVFKRRLFFFVSDVIFISFSIYISFWMRYTGVLPTNSTKPLLFYVFLALIIKLSFLIIFNLYDISWQYVSMEEFIKIFKALFLSTLVLGITLYFLRVYTLFKEFPFPRSTILLDFLISFFLISSIRISKRAILEGVKTPFKRKIEKVSVLIYGAGGAGEQIVREMQRNKSSNYLPIGFIDDDPAKQGIKIHGIKVLGGKEDIQKIIKNNKIDELLIALPSAHSKEIKKIVEKIRKLHTIKKLKILPSVTDLLNGKVTLSDIQEIKLEDLLGRSPVKIDFSAIKRFIQEKKILITGAGGSIGVQLVKTVLQFNPRTLVAIDIDETELLYLVNKIKYSKQNIIPVIGDIKDKTKMDIIFERFSPQIVIHSAALKHVPILEFYPEEAVKTNIHGTKILAELSLKYDLEKFIFISTDKAINPTSVMGATKRAGEELLKLLNQESSTKFISVRFGNVLGSRGSVIPLFEEQIKSGGPVTITHPEMKRYFMSISEAVLLVLEAAAIGQGGEVLVLDMGEPIKILDLAKEMIKLSGYEPDSEIPIIFSEIRPGEKLFEEILSAEEGVETTEYEKIFKARGLKKRIPEFIKEKIDNLITISYKNNKKEEIIKLLKDIVPTYKPSEYISSSTFW